MKGLLLKDWYVMKKTCRAYLLLVVVFLAISAFGGENVFMIFYPAMLVGMIPVTLLGYDERCKWQITCAAMPCTRAQFVSAKYLVGLLAQLATLALTALAQALRMTLNGGFHWLTWGTLLAVLLAMSLLTAAITPPFMFRFGVEKGRILYCVTIGLMCGGSTVVGLSGALDAAPFTVTALVGMVAAAAAVYALSWRLSIALYQKREL